MNKVDTQNIYDSGQRQFVAWEELLEIFKYKHLIFQFVRRDILTRYKRSILGVAWTMLNPLGTMLVLTIAFSQLFGRDPSYPAYVLSGLMVWTFFSQTTNATIKHNIWGGDLLKRIYAPRTVFAVSAMGTGLINLVFSIVPLVIVMLIIKVPIRPVALFLPVPMILLAGFSLGIGLIISSIAIYFPDVIEMYQIGLRGWLYLTPIIYPENILNPTVQLWMSRLNPMYHLVRLYRLPLYNGRLPNIDELWPALVVSGLSLVIGWMIFTWKSDEFAYRV